MGNPHCVTAGRQPGQLPGCYLGPVDRKAPALQQGRGMPALLHCFDASHVALRVTKGRWRKRWPCGHRRLRCGLWPAFRLGYSGVARQLFNGPVHLHIEWAAPGQR